VVEGRRIALRVLIDACLTPTAIDHLKAVFDHRIDVVHVDQVLAQASSDARVLEWATAERRVVMTANEVDFVGLPRGGATHAGLGLISDQDTRDRQIIAIEALARAMLGHVESGGDVAGRVFILRAGGRLSVRALPGSP
jgi:predicted nuclease of predicted toxin-antitoxin system